MLLSASAAMLRKFPYSLSRSSTEYSYFFSSDWISCSIGSVSTGVSGSVTASVAAGVVSSSSLGIVIWPLVSSVPCPNTFCAKGCVTTKQTADSTPNRIAQNAVRSSRLNTWRFVRGWRIIFSLINHRFSSVSGISGFLSAPFSDILLLLTKNLTFYYTFLPPIMQALCVCVR